MVVVHIQTGQKGRPEDVQMTASETTTINNSEIQIFCPS